MSKNEQHWEKTRGLLFVTLAIWFVFSIGIFLFGAEMNEVTWTIWLPINLLVHLSGFSWNFRNPNFLVCGIDKKKLMKNLASVQKERMIND